jgi:hypothetical protein
MDSITINEIKEAACGVDEEGTPKSIVICGLQRFNVNDTTEDPQSLMESSTIEAEVEIKTIGVFSYVNLKFPGASHSDLSLFYRCLERYYETSDEEQEGFETVAFISIIPLELTGEYLINATYPIFWALEPDIPNDPPRTLRVVFAPEDVQFIRSDLNNDDVAAIIAAAEAEALAEDSNEPDGFAEPDNEDLLEARNRAFTDDKYSPENNFGLLTFDEDDEE